MGLVATVIWFPVIVESSRHTVNSSSIMVSETETEEEILFDKKSKRKMNNDLSKYGSNAQLINPAKLQ